MNNALVTATAMNLPVPSGQLDSYLREIYRIPVLSAEREQELAIRLRDKDDLQAARELVVSHLRFVAKIARGYSGYGLPLADLIQEAVVTKSNRLLKTWASARKRCWKWSPA
jgi:RNA polymerase sigma-32 factor